MAEESSGLSPEVRHKLDLRIARLCLRAILQGQMAGLRKEVELMSMLPRPGDQIAIEDMLDLLNTAALATGMTQKGR